MKNINKKIGIATKKLNYYEINDDSINYIKKDNTIDRKINAIKVNINNYNNQILIKLYKHLIKAINKFNINTNKYLFYVNKINNNISYLNELVAIYEADNISNIKEKYSYIYEYVSKELDKRFSNYNICDFKNNICCRKRCLLDKFDIETLKYGCCYTKGKVCKYLDKNHCTINCLPCKFFTCNYLKKKGYNYKPSDFAIINYFFNLKQKRLLSNLLFTDKEDIIDLLIKNKSRFIK